MTPLERLVAHAEAYSVAAPSYVSSVLAHITRHVRRDGKSCYSVGLSVHPKNTDDPLIESISVTSPYEARDLDDAVDRAIARLPIPAGPASAEVTG